jgi:hypothetical protein
MMPLQYTLFWVVDRKIVFMDFLYHSGGLFQARMGIKYKPETHTKRQATQHGCLSSLLGNRVKGIEIVFGEEKYILYCID